MRINPKSQKGAITLVVLVTMLFLTAFLMTMYIRVANKAEISAETTAEILKKYNNIGDKNSLYYSYFTDSNIIPITNRAELEEIGSNKNITVKGKVYKFIPNGNYIVMNDIDLGGEETPWIPIPEKNEQNENRFTGVLDGLGYTIKGLYINDSSLNNQGLFSILNGTVRNINISNSYLNGKDNVGAIAGTNGTNGLIENCFNKSTVIGINYVGGIVGNSNGTVKNCKNVGNIIGQTNVIGGYFYVINENQEVPVEVWSKTSTLSQNYYFKSGTDVATVPKGFKVSANLDEQTIKDGLVIEDSDENEFVWVPVALPILTSDYINNYVKPNVSGIYTESKGYEYMLSHNIYPMAQERSSLEKGNYEGSLYSISGTNTLVLQKIGGTTTNEEPENVDNYESILNKPFDSWTTKLYYNEFDSMITSVASYGGFYVGRYEISLDSTSSYAQSKKNQTALVSNTWYNMYALQTAYATINSNLGVNSHMIWGTQWDQLMLFVNGKKDGEGNNFYITTTGSRNVDAKTGMNIKDKVCNIYDLEAGRQEWTQEAYGTRKRVIRGGTYSSNDFAAQRITDQTYNEPVNNNTTVSSRLALYIKSE